MTDTYVAVIFTTRRRRDDTGAPADDAGYTAAAAAMEELAARQPGYRSFETARNDDGLGISVSYWSTHEDAVAWKHHRDHLAMQQAGRDQWYEWYRVRIATVERDYSYDWAHGPTDPTDQPQPKRA